MLNPLNWDPAFGAPPTQVTVTVVLESPFPQDSNFIGGSVGSLQPGNPAGVVSASISDGVRTFTPDIVFLSGYGSAVQQWVIGGGFPEDLGVSYAREIVTANLMFNGGNLAGDLALFQIPLGSGFKTTAPRTSAIGQWTLVTP
jgi:hypothetical protein